MDDRSGPDDGEVGVGLPGELRVRAAELESRVPPASAGPRIDDERMFLEKSAALRAEADRAEHPDVSPRAPEEDEAPAGRAETPDPAPSARPDAVPMPTASFRVAVKDFHFPALPNGLDFLGNAVKLLARPGGPKPRDLKYAVLHLRTGAEVLLKARLEMHDPALVWTKPGQHDKAKHKAGAFNSCGSEKAIERLNELAEDGAIVLQTALDPEDPDLAALKELRNRLTHFGWSDTADAVQARTLPVLALVMKFVSLDVLPYIDHPGEAWTAEQEMDEIRGQLQHLADYMAHRKAEIADQLSGHEWVTAECRSCGQYAVVLDGGAVNLTCHFCGKNYGTGVEAAWEYIGESRTSPSKTAARTSTAARRVATRRSLP